MRPVLPLLLLLLAACSTADPIVEPLSCEGGLEVFRGKCVDPALRYQPETQLDQDNVVVFGDMPTSLQLPDPPNSGWRMVVPPHTLEPGKEVSFCASWPLPAIAHDLVYAARLYTTSGLHHSNVISLPVSPDKGENPYPGCHPGASDPFGQIGEAIADVLFANSTQVVGAETMAFPPGLAYRVHTDWEVIADVHMLNTTSETLQVEVVYDFYTMPASELVEELGPFVSDNRDFLVPAHQTQKISSECKAFGGTVVSIMPHTHDFATEFSVELIDYEGGAETVYLEEGYDFESDIAMYPEGLDLSEVFKVRHSCTFNNTKDAPLKYGLGDQEMCILFGYLYPKKNSFAAYRDKGDDTCTSIQIGLFK